MNEREKSPYTGFKGSIGTKPVHSGGFKYSSAVSQSQVQPSLNNNPSVVTDFYTTLGVNQTLESNIDKMKQQRFKDLQKELAKGFSSQMGDNVLKIYDGIGRRQQATHIPSSLLQPTLENVQAQLEAHRMSLKPLQQRYYQMKGIKHPLRSQESNIQTRNLSAQKQAKQLIYKLKNGQIGAKNKRQQEQQELQRMFEQKKKLDPKLAEYDRKFRQYKLEKQAIEQTKLQQNQSKLNQKRNNTSSKKGNKDKQILQKYKQEEENQLEVIQLERKYDPSKILATNNDKFICKYIFKQLDKEKKEIISKEQLYDFLLQNQMFMSNFKIDTKWFYSDIEMFETKRKGLMNIQQVTRFLVQNKLKAHPEIELVDTKATKTKSSSNCLLGSLQLNRLEELYKSIDKQDDKIVKRQQLIAVIYNDQYIISRLNNPAIKINQINKTVTLKQVLELILKEYRGVKNQSKKKAKQYITLKQFLDYFNDISVDSLGEQVTSTQESIIYDIDEESLELIKDIFDRVPRVYQNYIVVIDFVEECRRDPQYKLISEDICRIQSVETGLSAESIKLVVNRIALETDQYQNWETIKMFFSRRGRPIGWDHEKIKKKRQLREKQRKQQFNKMLKGLNPQEKQKYLDSLKTNKLSQKVEFNGINYTFPKPFDIVDERKKSKMKIHCQGMMDGQKQFDELKAGIQSLPLNKQMLQPKLQEMERRRKMRSDKNRQQSRNKLLNQQQPFSFHERDLIAKVLKNALDKEQKDKKKEEAIKPTQPPSNLKKTYKQIMQQEQKKRLQKKKQNQKQDDKEISKRLYPDDPSAMKKQKEKKVLQKQKKILEAEQKKKQQLERQRKRLADKNKQKQKKLKQLKEQQQKQRRQKEKLENENQNLNYKPKINEFQDKGKREQGKRRREEKQKKEIEQMIKRKQQQRNKRLNYKPQQQPKLNITNMDQQDIIDRLSEISLSDLLQEQQKQIWIKRRNFQKIPFSNKYKTNKERQKAIMIRQRKQMQQEQRARRQELRERLQSKIQNKKDEYQKGITNQNQKNKDKRLDPKSLNSKFNFNQSRALKRYYDLMEGKVPPSQYDRMSNEAKTVISQGKMLKMVQQHDEDIDK